MKITYLSVFNNQLNQKEVKTKSKMQLKIKLRQLFTKNNCYIFVSTILFIVCTAFVAYRGYKCFDKYYKKPKHSEVSYESSKNHPFPSFTLCASYNVSYNEELIQKCQIKPLDYVWGGPWVGKGGINCTDPELLHNQVAANSKDLEIERIVVITKAATSYSLTLLEWKLALTSSTQRCFTFSIPDVLVREGISNVAITTKAFDALYLHKEGTLSAPIPGSSLRAKYADLYKASVTHQSIELLNYDGKNCNNDGDYNYDTCKENYIYKVYQNETKMIQ